MKDRTQINRTSVKDALPQGELHIAQPKFKERGEWDSCKMKNNEHDWLIIAYHENLNPGAGVAICTKCAELKTGWVANE